MTGTSIRHEPPRLLILIQDLEFGGTQRYVVNLLRHLDHSLFRPELWVMRGGEDLLQSVRETGVTVTFLSKSSWVTPYGVSHLAWRLFRYPPDLIYTLTVVPNIWGRLFASMAGVPVVSGYRSLIPNQREKYLWRLSNLIVCNAEASKRMLMERFGAPESTVAVIPNGVDTDFFCPPTTSRAPQPTVVYVGRLVEEKDPVNLVEAFRLTARELPEARFRIVGDGPLKSRVEELVHDYQLESRITLCPATADVRSHLWDAWIFVIGSASESSPNVVIEAMATGLPVVGTRVGGIPELIREGETGLMVEPRNPTMLAEALTELLRNEPLRHSMGIRARETVVADYALRKMVQRTQEAFLEVLRRADLP